MNIRGRPRVLSFPFLRRTNERFSHVRPSTPSPSIHPPTKSKKQGRYDDLKTAQENIDLQTTILSRFDLIFIVRDERLYERDLQIADHVLSMHASAGDDRSLVLAGGGSALNPEQEREQKFLKRYIEYCRSQCSPRIVPRSAKMLEDQYVKYRQEMRERAKKGGAPAVPITVRQVRFVSFVSFRFVRNCRPHDMPRHRI